MRVKIHTLGCKVNQYESEAILKILRENGIEKAEKDDTADIVIINSCTVTAQSDQKVRQTLRRAKKNNPNAVIVLTGCMAQAFPDMAERLEEADVVLGTANRSRLIEHIMSFISTRQRVIDISEHKNGEKFESMEIDTFSERTRAFIKIQDGCNRFCSYCIIPYARGRVRSKPIDELRTEIKNLGEKGYKELVLTGINLSTYGQEFGLSLSDAIEVACSDDNIKRVRLGSLEPEELSPEVIERLSKQPKLCPQFHLSLQSGCDETLKRMNRHYTTDEYRTIVKNLRAAFTNAAITTDIMVGFAGETDEEFEQSLAFAKEIAFAKVHVFAYSRRPGTKAYDFPNQLSNKVKDDRSHRMIEATLKTQEDFFKAQIGQMEKVLIEREISGEKNLFEGYTMNYTPVILASPQKIRGEIVTVEITDSMKNNCIGKIIDT